MGLAFSGNSAVGAPKLYQPLMPISDYSDEANYAAVVPSTGTAGAVRSR